MRVLVFMYVMASGVGVVHVLLASKQNTPDAFNRWLLRVDAAAWMVLSWFIFERILR